MAPKKTNSLFPEPGSYGRGSSGVVTSRLSLPQLAAVRTLASQNNVSIGELIRRSLVRLASEGTSDTSAIAEALGLQPDATKDDLLAALEDLVDQLRGTPALPEDSGPVLSSASITILSGLLGCPRGEVEAFARSFRCAIDQAREADLVVHTLTAKVTGKQAKPARLQPSPHDRFELDAAGKIVMRRR
jgi:hypothetical protein